MTGPGSGPLFPAGLLITAILIATNAMAADYATVKVNAHSPGKQYTNLLAHESSPYLLQHAHNPVDWYPWGEDAFARARHENKPVFLSIGYSTCHWCHVMEEEIFSDPEAAELINRAFVPIKVDREERPDIDQVYMTVSQVMTGSGGWPLNVFLTPEKKPFFVSTYIPKHSGFGRVGIMDLVPKVEAAWKEQRQQINNSADKITDALKRVNDSPGDKGKFTVAILKETYQQLATEYDSVHGGFGRNRKFPMPHNLRYLLRYWKHTGDKRAMNIVEHTLDTMRQGGIYDHIGYGFHRYATDSAWKLPHFEKMLYDQALIAMAYLETYAATGKSIYAETARQIFTYVLRDMRAPGGVFYSAEDADSEGKEGLFYLWTKAEIDRALDKKTARLFSQVYQVEAEGNFEDEASGKKTNRNILFLNKPWSELSVQTGMPQVKLKQLMDKARLKLLALRSKRVRPLRDEKVLTDWNGLMIAALAMGARILQEPAYAEAANRAADFILGTMRDKEGGLLHRWHKGQAGIEAKLDDYAFFVWGLIELYQAEFNPDRLAKAMQLNDIMIRDFEDGKKGGFFLTAHDAEALLVRPIDVFDGALPSGNAVSLLNILRLARLTSSINLEKKAQKTATAFAGTISKTPSAFAHFMMGMDFSLAKGYEIVIAGDPEAADTRAMLEAIRPGFLPNTVVLLRPDNDHAVLDKLAPFTRIQEPVNGKATAYVCRDFACNAPTTDINKMLQLTGKDAH
ncbi:MAG: thioredoxin domain-containing protein [Mariprofundaceae bacterium]